MISAGRQLAASCRCIGAVIAGRLDAIPRGWRSLVGLTVVCIVGQFVVLRMAPSLAFPLDDAYIVLHNAGALFTGDDNFPGAAPLIGSTSLLHTLALAIVSRVLPGELSLWLLSWLAIFASAVAFDRLGARLGLPEWQRGIMALCVLLSGHPLLVLLNGVETGWAIAAMAWALVLAASSRPGRLLPLLCGALPFVRPELAALALILMIDQARRHLTAGVSTRYAARWVLADVGVFALAFIPLVALQYASAGSLMPISAKAKQYFFEAGAAPSAAQFATLGRAMLSFGLDLGPILFAALLLPSRISLLGAAFAGVLLAAFLLYFPSGLWHNEHRYLYLLVPVLGANLFAAMAAPQRRWRSIGAMILGVGFVYNLATLPSSVELYTRKAQNKLATMSQLATWIESNLDPQEPLLIHDVGYVAYATSQRLVDLVGLKSPESVELHHRFTYRNGEGGRPTAIEEIARLSGSRYIVVSAGWESSFAIAAGLRARGWTLTPLSTTEELKGYKVYRLQAPRTALPAGGNVSGMH